MLFKNQINYKLIVNNFILWIEILKSIFSLIFVYSEILSVLYQMNHSINTYTDIFHEYFFLLHIFYITFS